MTSLHPIPNATPAPATRRAPQAAGQSNARASGSIGRLEVAWAIDPGAIAARAGGVALGTDFPGSVRRARFVIGVDVCEETDEVEVVAALELTDQGDRVVRREIAKVERGSGGAACRVSSPLADTRLAHVDAPGIVRLTLLLDDRGEEGAPPELLLASTPLLAGMEGWGGVGGLGLPGGVYDAPTLTRSRSDRTCGP